MSLRFATAKEITNWDALVAANSDGGHILQTRAWGEFKAQWRWKPRYVVGEKTAMLWLSKRIGGLGELWYCPKGPGIATAAELPPLLDDSGVFSSAFLLQVEPELGADTDTTSWRTAGWRKARRDVQISRATIIVDLRPDEETLLASFKSKCRYNIRLADRKGVTVRHAEVDDTSVDTMFSLMADTQSRAGFTLRQREYFEGYWRLQHAAGQGDFFFASVDGTVVAGVFVTHFGKRAWYKDGGSTKEHSELMAPHLLQWEVMRWLKGRGVESYDLVAVPRPSELDETHPLWGLYRFKSGFNADITEFVGTWEKPMRDVRHRAWDLVGSRVAHQWSYRVHHDLLY